MRSTRRGLLIIGILGCLAIVAACDEHEEIREREVPAGSEPITGEKAGESAPPSTALSDRESGEGASWPWLAPEGWVAVEEARPMRLATYEIPLEGGAVEVAITRFAGDVGGMLANVNRWRGQIGLPPVTEAELPTLMETFESAAFQGSLFHFEGPEQHMLAASLFEAGADQTWFVRVTDSAERVGAVKDSVFEFARSFGSGG